MCSRQSVEVLANAQMEMSFRSLHRCIQVLRGMSLKDKSGPDKGVSGSLSCRREQTRTPGVGPCLWVYYRCHFDKWPPTLGTPH